MPRMLAPQAARAQPGHLCLAVEPAEGCKTRSLTWAWGILQAAPAWMGQRLTPLSPVLGPDEQAWLRFLEGEVPSPPDTPLAPTSPLMPRLLRHWLAPLRQIAASQDPSFERVFGHLPPV